MTMKSSAAVIRSAVVGAALLATSAFGGFYQDTVQSTGPTFAQGTAYGTPSGATVEGYAYLWGSASAGFWITGAGINVYRSASSSSDAFFADYGSGGDIGYQIWASTSGGGYPSDYAYSTFVVSW